LNIAEIPFKIKEIKLNKGLNIIQFYACQELLDKDIIKFLIATLS